ncbi:hypothetical protein EVA_16051 [gut metagenome]|uniref:Uncharacterized protein n=1 Tax=gut metagenome TaxID=749906 RepID=J9G1Z8_9ZZZZ
MSRLGFSLIPTSVAGSELQRSVFGSAEAMKKFEQDTLISGTPKPDTARIRNTGRVINAVWFTVGRGLRTHGLSLAFQQPSANYSF